MASIFPHSVTAVMSHRQRMLSEDAHSTMMAMKRQESNESTTSVFDNGGFSRNRDSNLMLSSSEMKPNLNTNLIEQQQQQKQAQYPALVDMFQPIRRIFMKMPHNS